jgi:hypothetical protein
MIVVFCMLSLLLFYVFFELKRNQPRYSRKALPQTKKGKEQARTFEWM